MISLRHFVKSCSFGTAQLEDVLIRDQVVFGVKEDCLREKKKIKASLRDV